MDVGTVLGTAVFSVWFLGGVAFGALLFRRPFRATRVFVDIVKFQFNLLGCEEPRLSGFFMPPHMQYVWDNEEDTSDSADPNAQAWRKYRPFVRAMGAVFIIFSTGLLLLGILVAFSVID